MLYLTKVYKPIPRRWRQFRNGPSQQMSQRYVAFFALPIIITNVIRKYAKVAKLLYKLISDENAARKQNLIRRDHECEEAFDKLKELCSSTPILVYADFKKLFRLHTDASIRHP